jgi:hypothetical protein
MLPDESVHLLRFEPDGLPEFDGRESADRREVVNIRPGHTQAPGYLRRGLKFPRLVLRGFLLQDPHLLPLLIRFNKDKQHLQGKNAKKRDKFLP